MEKVGKSRPQDDRPISRVLLEGLHDPGSPLSCLRGTPHIMRTIWDLITAYWKTVIHLPGHQVENPNYVSQSDREDELIYTPYNDNPTCTIPFFLSPLMHPFTETTSGKSRLVSFPPPSGININMMPFVVGSSFKACRLPKYVRPYWDLILACIGPELNKEAEPWWPKTSDPSDLGKVSFLTFPFFKNLLKSQSDCIRSRYISSQYKRAVSRQVKHKEGLESMLTLQEK